MDLERARAGMLSLALVVVLGGFGCADQPEAPPADAVPATPASDPGMETEPTEGSGPEAEQATSETEGS